MKKSILIVAFALVTVCVKAQDAKNDTMKKPVYEKFYRVSPQVYAFLMQYAHNYKDGVIYNLLLKPEEKVVIQQNVDNDLFFINKNTKLDSVIVKK